MRSERTRLPFTVAYSSLLAAVILCIFAVFIAAQGVPRAQAEPQVAVEELPPGVEAQTILPDMISPVAMVFDGQGRLFYTEKTGAVRMYANGVLQSAPVKTFNVDTCGERGLAGITLDPDFSNNHFIYVSYTEASVDCGLTSNKVVRFVETGGTGGPAETIFSSTQTNFIHNVGNIHFGPDGKLYVTIGDNEIAATAQDAALKSGKMHRINRDGSIPDDNPIMPGEKQVSSVYAMGLRNSFDFTFDPLSGNLFATENGPDCNDEMNRIVKGFNYGWRDDYPCDDNNPHPAYNDIPPLWYLGEGSPDDTPCCLSPTGIEVYTGDDIPQWKNNLFMCNYKQNHVYGVGTLYRFYLDESRTALTDFKVVRGVPCALDLETGPEGALYFIQVGGWFSGTLSRLVYTGATPTSTPATPVVPTSTPEGTATFTATPVPTYCPIQFQDVPESNAFYPYINCLACLRIVGGYPCGGAGEPCGSSNTLYYRPGANVTRGQISRIVSEAAGFVEAPGEQVYEDVEPGSPFYAWINRLSNRGHMGGYACGSEGEPCGAGNRPYFRPNSSATRGQLAKIVANAAELDTEVSSQTYQDVPQSSDPGSFYAYIERLTERNVVGGYACGTLEAGSGPCATGNRPYFRPENPVTRGQAAKIVGSTFYPGCERAVEIRNFAYNPETVTVSVGATVRWTNYDLDYHTVTSQQNGGPLDSPNIQRNSSWSYTFNTSGEYSYYCKPHPYMQGKVVVTP